MTTLAAKPGNKPVTALFILKIPRKFRKVRDTIVLRYRSFFPIIKTGGFNSEVQLL